MKCRVKESNKKKKTLFTIGHSTRPIEYFLDLLKAHQVEMVVDVRTIPHSQHNPQFDQEELKKSLLSAHIRYRHLPKLGGLRHTTKDSLNTGWENTSFRGFADYMQTPPFWKGIEMLETLAERYTVAILCAEAVPWRCHRSLIADALLLRHWKVRHIQSKITAKRHIRTSFLKVRKGIILYPYEGEKRK